MARRLTPEAGAAQHTDREINRLYGLRRAAATRADWAPEWGGHAELTKIEAQLRTLEPDGDWRYEGYDFDRGCWTLRRPVI